MSGGSRFGVDLYWLPLGARGHFLRIGGRLFEAVAARLDRREARDIYHSVLEVRVPEGRFVIEMGPVADASGAGRGVVAEGPVGTRWASRLRIFRYEVRCWRSGITASTTRSKVRDGCPTTTLPPGAFSNSFASFPRQFGVAMNCGPARCGAATRSRPGYAARVVSRWNRSSHQPVAARQAGLQVQSPHAAAVYLLSCMKLGGRRTRHESLRRWPRRENDYI